MINQALDEGNVYLEATILESADFDIYSRSSGIENPISFINEIAKSPMRAGARSRAPFRDHRAEASPSYFRANWYDSIMISHSNKDYTAYMQVFYYGSRENLCGKCIINRLLCQQELNNER